MLVVTCVEMRKEVNSSCSKNMANRRKTNSPLVRKGGRLNGRKYAVADTLIAFLVSSKMSDRETGRIGRIVIGPK